MTSQTSCERQGPPTVCACSAATADIMRPPRVSCPIWFPPSDMPHRRKSCRCSTQHRRDGRAVDVCQQGHHSQHRPEAEEPVQQRPFIQPLHPREGGPLLDSTIKSRGEHIREHRRRFVARNTPGSGSFLSGQLDLSRVALVGHSRGGDAVVATWE
jgi:hypothetical protein